VKIPAILFWRTRIDEHVWACHAVRNWDRPSNGVFMLVTTDELFCREWSKRLDWRGHLADKLGEREKRLFREYGRFWKDYLCEYTDDELWCPV
jgi:hypothetical protein